MGKEILAHYYDEYMSAGVYYTKETGNLSIYTNEKETIRVKKKTGEDIYIKKPRIERLTLNLNTGACYVYKQNRRDDKSLKRQDFNEHYLNFPAMMVDKFLKKVIEETGLPIIVEPCSVARYGGPGCLNWNVYLKKRSYFSYYGEEPTLEKVSTSNILSMVSLMLRSPNVYIVNDTYTKEIRFREENPFKALISGGNDHVNRISGRIPLSSRFKRAQSPRLMDENEYIRSCIEATGVPASKAFMKYYRKNPFLIGYVDFIRSCGIKELDNILKMITIFERDSLWCKEQHKTFKKFVKAQIAVCGEKNTVNKLRAAYETAEYIIGDTITQYGNLLGADHEGIEIPMKGSIKELHDEYSLLWDKLSHKNRPIEPTKIEQKREFEDSSISIKLAEDTDRLIDIGHIMHICVGGYGNAAVNKRTTIYYMQDKSEKYIGCIEVKKNKLVQAKAFANGLLTGDAAKTLKNWVKAMRLNTENCYDYKQCCEDNNLKALEMAY